MDTINEFFDSFINNPSVQQTLSAIFKIFLSVVFGGIIGYERQHTHRPAGLRTHILVSIGSTLIMMTSDFIFYNYEGLTNFDPTRLGAQVISGIGFLGAGTIIREGFSVKGLTTAASLWAVSCVGLAIGSEYYVGATVATVAIYVVLNTLKRYVIRKHPPQNIFIEVENLSLHTAEIPEIIARYGANLISLEIVTKETVSHTKENTITIKAIIAPQDESHLNIIMASIRSIPEVVNLYVK